MPRMSNHKYLRCHKLLRPLVEDGGSIFYTNLSAQDQAHLISFFWLDHKATEAQLLEHRASISALHPTLPSQAGKALKRLLATPPAEQRPTELSRRAPTARPIRIRAIRRKQIDEEKLALAFLMLAKALVAERRLQSLADDRPVDPDIPPGSDLPNP